MYRFLLVAIALTVLTALTVASAAERVVQYRGDRNGFFAGARPSALEFDLEKGSNVRWMTPTPNWGYGHPLVVGKLVIVVDEPGWEHDFPVITAYDLKTGKQVWQTEIDHLPAITSDKAEQAKVRKALHGAWANFRKFFLLHVRGRQSPNEAEKQKIREEALALNPKLREEKIRKNLLDYKHSYGRLRLWDFNDVGVEQFGMSEKEMSVKYGICHECFYGFGLAREGVAFPAPISDGEYIYWGGLWGSRVCLNLDGTIKWLAWQKHPAKSGALGYSHYDAICRTPIIWNGQLIFDNFRQLDAWDCKTGKKLWDVAAEGVIGCAGSSKIMEVDGKTLHISGAGSIVCLDDHTLLTENFAAPDKVGMGHTEIATIDDLNLLMYAPAKGQKTTSNLLAKRLSFKDGSLAMEEAWNVDVGSLTRKGRVEMSVVVIGTTVYGPNWQIDAKTGKGKGTDTLRTRWLLASDGQRLYAYNGEAGKHSSFSVSDLSGGSQHVTGKPLERSKAMLDTLRERHLATFGEPNPKFAYSSPFLLVDDAIILRSNSYLICIGK